MTAAPPPDSHRALVAARRQRSLAWRIVHALGSLKLALVLLATIAAAIGIATFCESSFDTKVAQAYIYKAPWFLVWLGVLCVNLFAVTLTRWPWRRRHLGFVVTHYGIITLLVGAMVGSYFGFEGNVTLHKGAPPADRIVTARTILQIENPATRGYAIEPFDPALARPSERRPVLIDVPGSDLKIVADAQSENLVARETLAPSDDPHAPPGAAIDFATAMMGQQVSLPLLEGGMRDFFGQATIRFLPALPAHAPPLAHETQMVFARYAPVTQSQGGATGFSVRLSSSGDILTVTEPGGARHEIPRGPSAGKPIEIGGAKIEIGGYWPDFKIVNGQPATASSQPNNPAVLVRIQAPAMPDRDSRAKPLLELAPADGGLRYQLSRGDRVQSAGLAKVGEPFALGWADWKATVAQLLPRARVLSSLEPGPAGAGGVAGFRARLRAPDGALGSPAWIHAGELAPLTLGGATVRAGYGLELRPTPFTIALKNFEVPRVEGTDTPENFIATVLFRDKRTGEEKEGVARMNHPASWPGTALSVTTGLNYKFSQAEWNPDDLGETTLQVLYDPGWMLKWMGSLAICAGIFIMFYLRPKKS